MIGLDWSQNPHFIPSIEILTESSSHSRRVLMEEDPKTPRVHLLLIDGAETLKNNYLLSVIKQRIILPFELSFFTFVRPKVK